MTATLANPACVQGTSQAWTLNATCSVPDKCDSTSKFSLDSVPLPGCTATVVKNNVTSLSGTCGAKGAALPVVPFNCSCRDSYHDAINLQLENDSDVVMIIQSTAEGVLAPDPDTLCVLQPGASNCYVAQNFYPTAEPPAGSTADPIAGPAYWGPAQLQQTFPGTVKLNVDTADKKISRQWVQPPQ
jgi:hypothetical protein